MVSFAVFHADRLYPTQQEALNIDGTIWVDCVLAKGEHVEESEALKSSLPHINLTKAHHIFNKRHDALYVDDAGTAFLRVLVVTSKSSQRHLHILFVLTKTHIFTIRTNDMPLFDEFYQKDHPGFLSTADVFHGLMTFLIDYLTEHVETKISEIEDLFLKVVQMEKKLNGKMLFSKTIETITLNGKFLVQAEENLTNYRRIIDFAIHDDRMIQMIGRQHEDLVNRLSLLLGILNSLGSSIAYLGQNLSYLTDFVRSMMALRQNRSIIILSVIMAFFLPSNLLIQTLSVPFKTNFSIDPPVGLLAASLVLVFVFVLTYLFLRKKFVEEK